MLQKWTRGSRYAEGYRFGRIPRDSKIYPTEEEANRQAKALVENKGHPQSQPNPVNLPRGTG